MNATLEEMETPRIGRQTPTKFVGDESLQSFLDNPLVAKQVASWGIDTWVWQDLVLRNSLALKNNKLCYKNVGLSVARQNGKTYVIIKRAFIGIIYLGENMVYSSYRAESMNAIFERMLDIIETAPESLRMYFPDLPSRKTNNKVIVAKDPKTGKKLGQIRFVTRKGGGGRGKSESVIFIDEAQDLTQAENDAMTAGIATFKNGQVWYAGTAADDNDSATFGNTAKGDKFSNVFRTIRKQVLNGLPNSMWAEWGVDKMTPKTNRDAWYEANPSLGLEANAEQGLNEEFLESRAMSDESFNVEHLNYWSEQDKNSAIESSRWLDLELTPDEAKDRFKGGSIAIALKSDINDEKLDIAIAVRHKNNEEVLVEIVDSFGMQGAYIQKAWNFMEPYITNHKCKAIVIDGSTAKAQLKAILEANGKWSSMKNKFRQGKVNLAAPSDVSLSAALLVGYVNEKKVYHMGQIPLNAAVEDAGKRAFRSGSGYGFYSISGKTSANLVEVAALALHEASKQKNIEQNTDQEYAFGKVTSFGNVTGY